MGNGHFRKAHGMTDMQRPIGPRHSPIIGKNRILTMGRTSERLEKWGPDYQGPVSCGKEVDFTLEKISIPGRHEGGWRQDETDV